jgi:hypothetical protein
MVNLSLYISGQTEQNDVAEFFQKGLMNAGETPIAIFDGVFYESHQERVGNIAFQDYLIYSDKAVYLWARGTTKDYLDRFELGSVAVNSRNKDHDFATVNLKVRREGKEPVYVIFDMVELREAELIVRLHTVIESVIEQYMGLNYRSALPDDVSSQVLHASRSVCVPRVISLRLDAPGQPQHQSNIGYGQDLLEQYKASIGYAHPEKPPQAAGFAGVQPPPGVQPAQGGEQNPEAFSPADVFKKLESMLPGDPGSLKKVADSLKDMIGEVPMKLRDQFRNDMQHVPGMLTAINELLTNIADNPQAERFVMNIVKTAVRNDGMFGSVSKLIKISSSFASQPKKKQAKSSPKSSQSSPDDLLHHDRADADDDFDRPLRRKKITIRNDETRPMHPGIFDTEEEDVKLVRESRPAASPGPADDDFDESHGVRRKKISVKAPEEDVPALVRHMMNMDDAVSEMSVPEHIEAEKPAVESIDNGHAPVVSRKIRIVPETPVTEAPEMEFPADEVLQAVVSELEAAGEETQAKEAPAAEAAVAGPAAMDVPELNLQGSEVLEKAARNIEVYVPEVMKTEVSDVEDPMRDVPTAAGKPAETGDPEKTYSQIPAQPFSSLRKPDYSNNDASRKKFRGTGKHGRR